MKLKPFRLKDRVLFERYFRKLKCNLSGYVFENIFIWRNSFNISWALINNNLCIFFKDSIGMFMPIPPLGKFNKKTISQVFEIMEEVNHNADISRIENIEESGLSFYRAAGLGFYEKGKEYLVSQDKVRSLKGDKFKHKRNLRNVFFRNNQAIFRAYRLNDKKQVLGLYVKWMQERSSCHDDVIYKAMLKDSFLAFTEMLEHFSAFKITAYVVEIEGKVFGFTSGFRLNKDTFCVNFEVVDLKIKGLSVFIFSELAGALQSYELINIMDDSGLESIRRAKQLWHPNCLIPSYTGLKK